MSVFAIVSAAKILKKRKPSIDSFVFRLHYRITSVLFSICAALVLAKEYVGSPISCSTAGKSYKAVINTYCLIMSAFSVPVPKGSEVGTNIAYHGTGTVDHYDEEETNFVHIDNYYMWVPIVLILQSMSFYALHFVWKKIGSSTFETVAGGMGSLSLLQEDKEKKRKRATQYYSMYHGTINTWCYGFFCCEIANVVVALLNLYFIDHFLGGTFLTYGTDVINFPDMPVETRVDPMTRIFPKMAKCTFRKFGPSGSLEVHDAFCLLAVNIINEKIYIFIWFWLLGLIAVSLAWAVYRLVIIFSPAVRNKLLMSKGRLAGQGSLKIICDRVRLGDWFLIYQLGFHMEPIVYSDFLKDLAMEFQNTAPTLERKPMLVSN